MRIARKQKLKYNLIAIILIICISIAKISLAEEDTKEIIPEENQYMKLKASTINTIEGKDKQVIFELWSYDLEFEGFDVRFSYDGTQFAPSNLLTNEYTDVENEYFAFEDEFKNYMDFFTVEYKGTSPTGIRAIVSFDPPATETEHIKNKNGEMVVDTTGGVLLGKMSFRMKSESFDISSFKLETGETSPKTGIKINIDGETKGHYYEKQSVFRFTDETASRNANLSNLILSTGEKNDENPEESTYKEYTLNPEFKTETFEYTLEILEYIDKMNLTISKEDEKSTIKLKTPKRDENENLCYEADGTTIIYEENTITDLKQEITLNKLEEADTVIEVKVIAEDTITTNTYKITIHRPYGTIKGSVQLGDGLRESLDISWGVYLEYIANITLYKPGDFNWDGIITFETVLSDLSQVDKISEIQTDKDTGQFDMKVIPGKYDVDINTEGYLPNIIKNVEINEGDIFNIGNKILYEGDADGTGIIDVDDTILAVTIGDSVEGDGIYQKGCDFGRKGFIDLDDLTCTITNADKYLLIEDYKDY